MHPNRPPYGPNPQQCTPTSRALPQVGQSRRSGFGAAGRVPAGLMWLAVGWLAVACSTGKDTGDTDGETDFDGDGVLEASDCNDRDATIFPGADDAWYDGVDQDCAGDDDFDADGDGHRSVDFGGLDCNDADAAVSPGATEQWYDGVDQDCANDDDFDADRDGYSTDTDGADFDCDDNRSDVKPGAIEIWYDGIDGDCAGDDDFDADGDSFPSALYAEDGTDCDDDDDDIFPGATETWYDGIDSDCAGDDDFDADGDGEAAEGEVATGSDCDDTDPTIFSGAVERLDDLDSDCDGDDDTFTSDQDVLGSQVFALAPGDMLGTVLASGSIDSDAHMDLAIASGADTGLSSGGYGAVYFISGQDLTDSPLVAIEGETGIKAGSLTQTATGPIAALAIMGDYGDPSSGLTDYRALVGTPEYESAGAIVGGAWMVPTAISNFTTLTGGTSKWQFRGEVDGGEFGAVVLGDADFDTDGDGVRDIVISAPGEDGGTVYLFQSDGLFSATGSLSSADADVIFTGASPSGALGSSLAAGDFEVGADADDDGDAWLVIGDPLVNSGQGAVYVIRNDFAALTSGPVVDRSHATVIGTAGSNLGRAVATGETLQEGTDVQEELIIGAPRAITRAGQLQFFDGAAIFAGGSSLDCSTSGSGADCYLRYTGSAIDGFAGTTLVSGYDVSGNGEDDVLVGGPGNAPNGSGSGAVWLVADDIPSNGQSLINANGVFNGASSGDGLGYSMAMGDFDADGKGDVAYGAPGHDIISDEGLVRVYTSHYPEAEAE